MPKNKLQAWAEASGAQRPKKPTAPRDQTFVLLAASATVEVALHAWAEREGVWFWLLVVHGPAGYRVCSFGSLLPYLTGRTPHIVHVIGDCPICGALDPVLWRDTGQLAQAALADPAICARPLAELPLADLPVIEVEPGSDWQWDYRLLRPGMRVVGLLENGALRRVHVDPMRDALGLPGVPEF